MLTAWILAGVAILLIALCGVFVAAEFSFITASRTSVDRAVAAAVPGAAGVAKAQRTLSLQLSGAQVGITITNLLIGWCAEPSVATLIGGPLATLGVPEGLVPGLAFAIAYGLSTTLTMVFGELVPKNLAIAHPLGVARIVQLPQRWFTVVSRPLTGSMNALANRIVRWLGAEPQEELASARSAEELVSVVRSSAEEGVLPEPTARLVERSLRFDELQARDALTPRTKVVTVPVGDPAQRVIELSARHGLSRFPVVGADADDVVGVVELSRVVGITPAARTRVRVGRLCATPVFVPHTAALDEVLSALRDADSELAVVLDEYGGMAGIVTLEDLVEEIVGQVDDEHDPAADLVRASGGGWVVSGLLRPDELQGLTGLNLPKLPQRYETLAGLVLHRLGRLPEVGDELDVDGVRLTVERMDGHRIDLLRLQPFGRRGGAVDG